MLLWTWLLIVIFHALDMFFTVLIIEKLRYEDRWKAEYNYHRYFFKRFGIRKGALLSFPISVSVMSLGVWILNKIDNEPGIYMVLGMVITMAFINYVSWVSYDEMLIVKRNHLESILKKNNVKDEDIEKIVYEAV